MWLIGIGMFFDGFDIYIAATVLGATLKSGFSTLPENALFVSATFLGMMGGSFLTASWATATGGASPIRRTSSSSGSPPSRRPSPPT